MAEAVAFGEAADVESAIRRLLAHEISFDQFSGVFMQSTFWCRRGKEVGFLAVGAPGSGQIPIFTSAEALFGQEGSCPAFKATGRDLLMLAPEGYGLVVDPGSEVQLRVVPVKREVA